MTMQVFGLGKLTAATVGSVAVPFSTMFEDNLSTHGLEWTKQFYVDKNGMSEQEFSFWLGAGWIPEQVPAPVEWALWELEAQQ